MSSTEDHALGLELQLIELVERQRRARTQHRDTDADAVQLEIDQLQAELAGLLEMPTGADQRPAFHDADPAQRKLAG
jgi:hypothetical protein